MYTISTAIDNTFNGTVSLMNFQGNQYKKTVDRGSNNFCTLGYNDTWRENVEDFQKHQKYSVES
jgi:hypothetical protein